VIDSYAKSNSIWIPMGLGMDDMWNPEINCHVPSKMPQISDGRPHFQTHIADKEIMLRMNIPIELVKTRGKTFF
jgi:hypothetical protein